MSATRFRLGHPPARRPAAHHRHRAPTPTTSRCPTWCTPPFCAARTRTRASSDRHRARRSRRRACVAVYTGADTEGALKPMPCAWLLPNADLKIAHLPRPRQRRRPLRRRLRRRRRRRDAAIRRRTRSTLIDVDYEPLPAVVDPREGAGNGRAAAACGYRRAIRRSTGPSPAATSTPRSPTPTSSCKDRIVQQRLIPTAMETRGRRRAVRARHRRADALEHDAEPAHRPVPLLARDRRARRQAARDRAGSRRRIRQQDRRSIPGDFITVFCSMKLGRPVKWTETRSENYQATTHGRDHVQDVELAATRDGKILGLRCTVWAGMGAYLSTAAPGIPTILHGLMLSGPYAIPAVKEDVYGVYTNTTPVEAYRGAGRPEATFMLERMLDQLADELKIDPVDIRRRNLIPPFDRRRTRRHRPHLRQRQLSGARSTRRSKHIGYDELRAEQAKRARAGPVYRASACAPTSRSAASVRRRSPAPSASRAGCGKARSCASIRAARSTSSSARRRTARAKRRRSRRSSRASSASTSTTSRSCTATPTTRRWAGARTAAGRPPSAARRWRSPSRKIKDKAKLLAAHLLEAAPEDIDYEDGKFFVKGAPEPLKTIQDIALMANVAWNLPPGHGSRARGDELLRSAELRLSVRRARRRGRSRSARRAASTLKRYVAVDDCGPQINPVIVEGQVHGGVVQGIGQALWEGAVYDDSGQLSPDRCSTTRFRAPTCCPTSRCSRP